MQARTSRHPRGAPASARPATPRGESIERASWSPSPPLTAVTIRTVHDANVPAIPLSRPRGNERQLWVTQAWTMVAVLSSAARAPLRGASYPDGPAVLMLHRRCRDGATRPTAKAANAQYTRRSACHIDKHRGIPTALRQPQMIVEQSVSFRNLRNFTQRNASVCWRNRHFGGVESRGAVGIASRTRACPARGRCPICQRTIAPLVPPRMPRTPCAAHPSHRASRAR